VEFDKKRQEHEIQVAHVKAAQLQAEENQRQVNLVKQVRASPGRPFFMYVQLRCAAHCCSFACGPEV